MVVEKKEADGMLKAVISLNKDPLVNDLRPSIDVTMGSVVKVYGSNTVGVILTGMGKDGAEGMSKVKRKGGYTIAQDEKTSVIYGMNRVAVEIGAVRDVLSLYEIPKKIIEHL